MKSVLSLVIIFSFIVNAQQSIMLRNNEIELGMSIDKVWGSIDTDLNVIEDDAGSLFISDKNDKPIGIVQFENERVNKVLKDWGTAYKSNVGQVFLTLWRIFRQYGEEVEPVKVLPIQSFTPKGEKNSMQFVIDEYRYIDITIQHKVTIFEVLTEPEI
ncbi:MAG: hypothetical protein KJN64_14950 [Ignavibacteria bacterium]|nr:hypothetical protein [Ignavibacteria bacterium]MBT8382567.1 hypothetical protein [Ignavibacteria bacterium]MBT8390830.1 hypothetical protein [Ignavibacteria bacterium]NNJ53275.1 hypothetical protein [Ignavibacteriaceae bacterium]NNL22371.1 hypothetical protein [Ignavibacteriaceae bacterium]